MTDKERMKELVKDIRYVLDNSEGMSLEEIAGKVHAATPQTEAEIMKPVDFKTGIFGMRGDIELVKSKVKNWMDFAETIYESPLPEHVEKGHEMYANLILAYRHLEDARMRLGKAIQAFDGGKSCYPE